MQAAQEAPRPTRIDLVIALFFFAVLLVWSLAWYLERSLTIDAAYFNFNLLQRDAPFTALGRYFIYVQQVLPYLAMKAGLPLSWVLASYSLNYFITDLLVFAVAWFATKDRLVALAIPLMIALGAQHTFFYTASQTLLGGLIVAALYATYRTRPKTGPIVSILVTAAFFILIEFQQTVLLVPILFVLGYEFIRGARWKDPYYMGMCAGAVGIAAYVVLSIDQGTYESRAVYGGEEGLLALPRADKRAAFFGVFLPVNFQVLIALAVLIGFYATVGGRKHLLSRAAKAGWVTLFFGVYTFLMMIRFHMRTPEYIEHLSWPLVFIVTIPFCCDVLPRLSGMLRQSLLTGTLVAGLVGIFVTHGLYAKRLEWMDRSVEYLARYPEAKFVAYWDRRPRPPMIAWALGVETLLYTSVKKDRPVTIMVTFDEALIEKLEAGPDYFQFAGYHTTPRNQAELPENYLRIERTPYRRLTDEDHQRLREIADEVGYPYQWSAR